jgi:hypothetical protein
VCFAFLDGVGDVDGADKINMFGSVCAFMSLLSGTPEDIDGFDTDI